MNEVQAILDFFSRSENLSLGLSVAEQMDELRAQMNNRFWRESLARCTALIARHGLAWRAEATEDRNAPDNLVGLHCSAVSEQDLYLRPMLEQQYLGSGWRIYFGLMWSTPPAPAQLRLPEIGNLKTALLKAGFRDNESFLAWQWSGFHPRRSDFLLRYAKQPEQLLDELEALIGTLLLDHREAIAQANSALASAPGSLRATLNSLRDELLD
jgi:hypothetical protein